VVAVAAVAGAVVAPDVVAEDRAVLVAVARAVAARQVRDVVDVTAGATVVAVAVAISSRAKVPT